MYIFIKDSKVRFKLLLEVNEEFIKLYIKFINIASRNRIPKLTIFSYQLPLYTIKRIIFDPVRIASLAVCVNKVYGIFLVTIASR